MSLADLVNPPKLPQAKRSGKRVEPLAKADADEQREKKAAASARMKALNADPEFKAATSARMKALNADPEFKAKMKALHADPEFKAATSARMKALHADPEFVARKQAASRAALKAKKIARLRAELAKLEQDGE